VEKGQEKRCAPAPPATRSIQKGKVGGGGGFAFVDFKGEKTSERVCKGGKGKTPGPSTRRGGRKRVSLSPTKLCGKEGHQYPWNIKVEKGGRGERIFWRPPYLAQEIWRKKP